MRVGVYVCGPYGVLLFSGNATQTECRGGQLKYKVLKKSGGNKKRRGWKLRWISHLNGEKRWETIENSSAFVSPLIFSSSKMKFHMMKIVIRFEFVLEFIVAH